MIALALTAAAVLAASPHARAPAAKKPAARAASPVPTPTPAPSPAAPSPLSGITPTVATEALGGRLVVSLPPGVETAPRPHSIMAGDAPVENETRFVLDRENVRVVVLFDDQFATADSAGLLALVRADVASTAQAKKSAASKVQPLALPAPLTGVSVVPDALQCTDDGCFVEGAWVRTAEGEVEYVSVFTNAAGAAEPAAVRALAHAMLASIRAGGRTLPLGAGERLLIGFGERGALAVTVPEKTAVSIERGPDFDVLRLYLLRPMGQPEASLGVYIGGFPSFHPDRSGTKRESTILGRKTTWFVAPPTKSGLQSEQALVDFKDDESPYLHLFLNGDAASVPALRAMAESLHFAPRPKSGSDAQ